MKWTRNRLNGLVYALLILGAWARDHVVLIGWWLLILAAISADIAAFLLAYASAHRGLLA